MILVVLIRFTRGSCVTPTPVYFYSSRGKGMHGLLYGQKDKEVRSAPEREREKEREEKE